MIDSTTAKAIIQALRSGTVPGIGLEHLAVGIEPLRNALRESRDWVAAGHGAYKFIRGPYGAGKTFATSLSVADALSENFVASKVVISVSDTPLYRLSEVYRKMCQGICDRSGAAGGLKNILDRWLFTVQDQVMEVDGVGEKSTDFAAAVSRRIDTNLSGLGNQAGRLASCVKAYHEAEVANDFTERQGILDWMSGEPKVNAAIKRAAGVTGQLDNSDAETFLLGWLELIRQAKFKGLVLVLDETEVITRMHKPEILKSLEVLRKLIDAIDRNRFPGLFLLVTGTPDFFDGQKGVPLLDALHDRIKVTFRGDLPENLRQAQVRMRPFNLERLLTVARKVRDIYPASISLAERVPDSFIARAADEVTRGFGGHVDVVPRLFLRAFVDVLDMVDQYPDFTVDRWHYHPPAVQGSGGDMSTEEEEAFLAAGKDVVV